MTSFERKNLSNGTPNPKYIDLCDEDQPIAGQKFVCMSFISPEKIIKQREIYLFEKFASQWGFSKSVNKFTDFLSFIAHKYSLSFESLTDDLQDFLKEEQNTLIKATDVSDDFKNYTERYEDTLNAEFNKQNNFQTSVRGVKVRGVFSTQEEANLNCKKLREIDPNHDIYVGPMGIWIPFDPDAYKTGNVEFMEEELNQLHHEKLKNETEAKLVFEKRVKDAKRKAIEENIQKAKTSGNTLTQTITTDGDLIGVKETVDFESREVADFEPLMMGKTPATNSESSNNDKVEKMETIEETATDK